MFLSGFFHTFGLQIGRSLDFTFFLCKILQVFIWTNLYISSNAGAIYGNTNKEMMFYTILKQMRLFWQHEFREEGED